MVNGITNRTLKLARAQNAQRFVERTHEQRVGCGPTFRTAAASVCRLVPASRLYEKSPKLSGEDDLAHLFRRRLACGRRVAPLEKGYLKPGRRHWRAVWVLQNRAIALSPVLRVAALKYESLGLPIAGALLLNTLQGLDATKCTGSPAPRRERAKLLGGLLQVFSLGDPVVQRVARNPSRFGRVCLRRCNAQILNNLKGSLGREPGRIALVPSPLGGLVDADRTMCVASGFLLNENRTVLHPLGIRRR